MMKIDNTIIDKVLNNEASAEEAALVAEWFATDEGSEYLMRRLDDEALSLSDKQAEAWVGHPVPEERMRNRFMNHIKPVKKIRRFPRWVAAAVLLPFIFLSVSIYFLADRAGLFTTTEYAEFQVPCGEQMQVVLQDGTVVHLNSATRLRYPKKFGMFSRKVELWGEGYFVVTKEQSRPFIVDLKGVEVKVAGTQFNVKAYSAEQNVCVSLDEGGVVLKGLKGKEYPLAPGESAEYNRNSGLCQISKTDDTVQVSSWRSNSLNFYLTPLSEIIKVMERQYDAHFMVRDSALLNNRFTLSTSKVNVDDVLSDLEMVSQISFRRNKEGVFEVLEKE